MLRRYYFSKNSASESEGGIFFFNISQQIHDIDWKGFVGQVRVRPFASGQIGPSVACKDCTYPPCILIVHKEVRSEESF